MTKHTDSGCLYNDTIETRAREIFAEDRQHVYQYTDRMFAGLMIVQWIGAILAALYISPLTWDGASSAIHFHVWLAIFLGGILASFPVYLVWRPIAGIPTRYVMAISQVLFSSLLIHLTGGRIETHFHIFGSLAFLAMYRDWKVLIPATLIVAVDHLLRGIYWPESVYGISGVILLRSFEHAAWVLFEDFFLILSCRNSVKEMMASARQRAELESTKYAAEAADLAKSEFLANMSHEIRTPLNGILGFTDVMIRGIANTENERREYLGHIQTSGRHLLELINNILDISKIEAGQMTIELRSCSPHQVISEVLSIMRVQAQRKNIDLEYIWHSQAPESITTDPTKLRQMLLNLVGNAIKFTDCGSVKIEVQLDITQHEPLLMLDVIDSGIGIPLEKRANLFEPFVQADSSVVRKFGGTGLGLAISRRIARALGGDVVIKDTQGSGSTFRITINTGSLDDIFMLPAPSSDALQSQRENSQKEIIQLPQGKVLVVEDGEINRKLIEAVLAESGLEIEIAENGQIGVEKALQNNYDIILMDMQMPVKDGYTAATELRQSGIETPIIAMTAHAMLDDEQKCLAAGCSGYLSKPINISRLLTTVADALYVPHQVDAIDTQAAEAEDNERNENPLISSLPTHKPVFAKVVVKFVDYLEEQLIIIQEAIDNGDHARLAWVAHDLKGAAGSAGFADFNEPAFQLELMGKNQDLHAAQASLEELTKLSKRIVLPEIEVLA